MQIYDYHTAGGKNVIQAYFKKQTNKIWSEYQDIRIIIDKYGVLAFKEFLNTRQLRGKLWEIRFSNERIAYVILNEDAVIFVHAFKKQKNKTEEHDINLALKRLNEMSRKLR